MKSLSLHTEIPDAEVDVTQNPSNIVEVDDSLRPMQTLVAQIPQVKFYINFFCKVITFLF